MKFTKNIYQIAKKNLSVYLVGTDLLENLDALLKKHIKVQNFLILSDEKIFGLYGKKVINKLKIFDKNPSAVIVPEKERGKNLNILEVVIQKILSRPLIRNSTLIAIGGGAITDCGGFIASILLRGIKCVFIPTTLLGMVDAAIGGKNGLNVSVNDKLLKNMIGTFYQPDLVISDIDLFKTLPAKELKNGLGEVVKYQIAFRKPVINHSSMLDLVKECQKIKLDIVKQDPFDTLRIRETLNLGHTIGHAVESIGEGKYSHGESVTIGINAALLISKKMNFINQSKSNKIKNLITNLNLPLKAQGLSNSKILEVLKFDKKNSRFVLIKDMGNVFIENNVPPSIIHEVIKEITL